MGLNFDKHKEHLEQDIRAELQKKFGTAFEIEGIYDIVLSSYCPTFLFKINLENYKEKLDILVDGSDLHLKWGEKPTYGIQYKYLPETLEEGLGRIKTYLDQPEQIFLEPLTPENDYLKIRAIEAMVENIFDGKTETDKWEKPVEKGEDYRVIITSIIPNYKASFTLELLEQDFIVRDIVPLDASVGSQELLLDCPVQLNSSNLSSFLSNCKTYLEEHLEKDKTGMSLSTASMSDLELILNAPLSLDTVDTKVLEIQKMIEELFLGKIEFDKTTKETEGDYLYRAYFFVRSRFYRVSFMITLIGQHFYIMVSLPDHPELRKKWPLRGYPYKLTEANLRLVLKEVVAYGLKHKPQTENEVVQEIQASQEVTEPTAKIQTQEREAKDGGKEQADKRAYLGLRKLWKLQVFIFFILMIIAFSLEVYMARSGYKAFKMRIQFSWVSMHSFSFLFLSMYGFLTLYPNGMKINEFLQQYPRWKGFPTKGVSLPEKETLWTIFILLLVLLFGAIDFSVRKPEPKVEIHKLSQELYRGFE
ncbi:hypothetical protein FOA39_04720 [Streptococcus cristatus]|nr:hypothetical protein [Streptococcus cristatus]